MTKKKKNKEKQQSAPEPKQPVILDQHGDPIPFFSTKKTAPKKKGYQFGMFSFLGLVAALILLATLTPLYSVLMLVTPAPLQEKLLWPLYRNVHLYEAPQEFSEPIKVPIPEPGTLPVLGFDTGICFSFHSTRGAPNPEYLSAKRLEDAFRGKNIAEIIAVGKLDKYEYTLGSVTYNETIDNDKKETAVICQKFGRAYGATPKEISALYIRPLEPFTAHKTVWNSLKHLYDDYTSPIEPLPDGEPEIKIIP